MSHTTLKSGYEHLVDRLNRFPQGAPPSETLFKILALLFSEREAELVSLLPIKPFTVETAARAWKMDILPAQKVLDELSSRAILVDVDHDGKSSYTPAAPDGRFLRILHDAPARGCGPKSPG